MRASCGLPRSPPLPVSFRIISLPRRTDRRDAARRWMPAGAAWIQFWDAVDGARIPLSLPASLPSDMLARMRVMGSAGARVEGNRRRKTACLASHAALLQHHGSHGVGALVVLEDDVAPAAGLDVPKLTALARRIAREHPDGVTYLAGRLDALRVRDMREFARSKKAAAIAATLREGANALDKAAYRVSSAGAYLVPSPEVAERLVREMLAPEALNHADMLLYACPSTKYLHFPAAFVSYPSVARKSDVIASQTQLCRPDYT